jgi:hypothetical protein
MIRADLVAEAARPAVDHHAHLSLVQPEGPGRGGVEHLAHRLDFEEVVPRSEAPHLPGPPGPGPLAHGRRVRAGQDAPVLAAGHVGVDAEAVGHGVRGPAQEERGELLVTAEVPDPAGAEPGGDPPVQFVHEPLEATGQLPCLHRGDEEPHPARDVESHPARRDDAAGGHVRGGNPTDGKAVAPVHVGHGVGRLDDAGEGGHVGDLGEGLVGGEVGKKGFGGEDDPRDPHGAGGLDPPAVGAVGPEPHRGVVAAHTSITARQCHVPASSAISSPW